MNGKYKPILLVDNDTTSAEGIKQAFEDLEVTNPLVHFSDPDKALGYLRNEKEKSPWLIFLTFGQQDAEDMEFLNIIKSDRRLKLIPVVLLVTSRAKTSLERSFDYGAAGYIVRPSERTELAKTLKAIIQYWTLSKCPANGE